MTDQTPIQVHASPTAPQIAAALRQVVLMLGPLMGAIGYAGWAGQADQFLQVVGPVSAVIAFIWGQLATRKAAKQQAVMAPYAPESVATFK